MNHQRAVIIGCAALLTAPALLAAGWGGGQGSSFNQSRSSSRASESHASSPSRGNRSGSGVIYKRHDIAVPRPNRAPAPTPALRERPTLAYPKRDERGAAISKPAAGVPPRQHVSVARNMALVRNIQGQQGRENVRQHFYWHNEGGVRYWHYSDRGGVHWYGFYHGPTFYWTRLSGNRWWWFDARFNRWAYWWSGFWWWPGPQGVEYVYVDNAYYPYQDPGVVTVQNPEVQPPPSADPAPGEGQVFTSPDGTRMVQIFGEHSDAFLYDKTGPEPKYLAHLGQGVEQVRFELSGDKKTLRILADFKDGNYSLFDAGGASLEAPQVSSDDMPGPPPTEVPPAPGTPPAQ